MSLEDKIDTLTKALDRNSDLLEILTAKAKASSETKPIPAAATEPPKAAAAEEAPKRGRPAKAAAEKPAKAAKVPTPAEMSKATTDFLEVDAEDEYNARRDLVKKILGHFESKKMSEIAEADRQKALDMLSAYKAGDDPFEDEGGAEEDDLA